jgi:hypothetical protein
MRTTKEILMSATDVAKGLNVLASELMDAIKGAEGAMKLHWIDNQASAKNVMKMYEQIKPDIEKQREKRNRIVNR